MSAAAVVAAPVCTPGSAVQIKKSSLVGLALVAIGLTALVGRAPGQDLSAAGASAPVAVRAEEKARDAYGKLPLAFVPNEGQTDARVSYSAQAGGASFYFTQTGAVFSFAKGKKKGAVLRLSFLGANPAPTIEGRTLGTGRVNYLLGNEPAKWHTNLPTYGEVVYRDLWPGVDMVFRGASGRLKYEFHLRSGAKVSNIRLGYSGTRGLTVNRAGELLIQTPLGILRDERPRSYQQLGGRRVPVASRFALQRARNAYGFAVGGYNRSEPLVIDPGLLYSTYLGGSNFDQGLGIAVDGTDSAYVTGETHSTDFPTTAGAFDITYNGGGDAFVTKLNPAGSAPLVYSTYLGGSSFDRGFGIAVDTAGSTYVSGRTHSADFPTTPGAFDITDNGGGDAFVAKLSATGSAPLYSTYLGGSSFDEGFRIAVDSTGSAYATGVTCSGNFPTTFGAFDTTANGSCDAYVTKLNAAGSAPLLYSTYLGGGGTDVGYGIAVDSAGSAYVTGYTFSGDFPTTALAFDTTFNGISDAFVTKLNAAGTGPLLYSTYLGGGDSDVGQGIAIDSGGSAYVTGYTCSADFPTTLGAFDTTFNGGCDAFVTKLNAAGSAPLLYSTYLGGSSTDFGQGIAIDSTGSAYVTGYTCSAAFPTTLGAFDTTPNSCTDAFVTKLNAAGSAPLLYSTYLGGNGEDFGFGIAVDSTGSAYVTGRTGSGDFPTTPTAYDTTQNGNVDAFVTKLDAIGAPAVLTLSPLMATNPTGTSHTVTATVTDAAGQPVPNVVVRFRVMGAHNLMGSCTTGANGQCTFSYTGTVVGTDTITAYADSNNNSVQDPGEPSGGPVTKTWILSPACPPGDDDGDDDGLEDRDERLLFFTLLGDRDSDDDGRRDGDDDEDRDGRDDEDEDDGTDDECPNDSDGDGEDDEDEDDDDDRDGRGDDDDDD
jgi:hypothetical protein